MTTDKTGDRANDKTDDPPEPINAADRLTTNQVARLLLVTPERIRQMDDAAVFKDVLRTPLGRLFSRAEVEALKARREIRP